MNQNLLYIPTGDMSREDWLSYRMSGIGASEVGAILGLSPYKSSMELFYEKIGEIVRPNVENIFTFMGKQHEDTIAELWQYWEGSEESMIENQLAGRIIRKCQRVNAFVRNPRFPWLYVSLDRKINKTAFRAEGALEIKTISSYEADKWAAGIPPSHVVQLQTQAAVCEFTFGELVTLKDGRRFDVTPFDENLNVQNTLIERTKAFWDKVLAGRKLMTQRYEAERNFRTKDVQDIDAALHQLEPPPDGSDAYLQYMKAKYHIAIPGEKKGGEEELQAALRYKAAKEKIKEWEEAAQKEQATLCRFLGEMDSIDLGVNGYVSWKANSKGVRTFRNGVK